MSDESLCSEFGQGSILLLPTSTEGMWVCVTTSGLNPSSGIKLQKQHEQVDSEPLSDCNPIVCTCAVIVGGWFGATLSCRGDLQKKWMGKKSFEVS